MNEKPDRPSAGCNACYPSASCPEDCRQRNDVPSRRVQIVFPNYGWICPKCGRGNAPSTATCPCGPSQ